MEIERNGQDPSSAGVYQVSFGGEVSFNSSYQRNNKKGGKKHLRCFPCCGPNHKSSHACEVGLVVEVESDQVKPENCENFLAVARFLPLLEDGKTICDDDITDKLGDISLGQTLTADKLGTFERTNESPFLPLYRAKTSKYTEHAITFEFREKAWHYGWKGGRYKQNTEHILRVYILLGSAPLLRGGKIDPSPKNVVHCVAVISSTPFTIYSSRSVPSAKAASPAGVAASVGAVSTASAKRKPQTPLHEVDLFGIEPNLFDQEVEKIPSEGFSDQQFKSEPHYMEYQDAHFPHSIPGNDETKRLESQMSRNTYSKRQRMTQGYDSGMLGYDQQSNHLDQIEFFLDDDSKNTSAPMFFANGSHPDTVPFTNDQQYSVFSPIDSVGSPETELEADSTDYIGDQTHLQRNFYADKPNEDSANPIIPDPPPSREQSLRSLGGSDFLDIALTLDDGDGAYAQASHFEFDDDVLDSNNTYDRAHQVLLANHRENRENAPQPSRVEKDEDEALVEKLREEQRLRDEEKARHLPKPSAPPKPSTSLKEDEDEGGDNTTAKQSEDEQQDTHTTSFQHQEEHSVTVHAPPDDRDGSQYDPRVVDVVVAQPVQHYGGKNSFVVIWEDYSCSILFLVCVFVIAVLALVRASVNVPPPQQPVPSSCSAYTVLPRPGRRNLQGLIDLHQDPQLAAGSSFRDLVENIPDIAWFRNLDDDDGDDDDDDDLTPAQCKDLVKTYMRIQRDRNNALELRQNLLWGIIAMASVAGCSIVGLVVQCVVRRPREAFSQNPHSPQHRERGHPPQATMIELTNQDSSAPVAASAVSRV